MSSTGGRWSVVRVVPRISPLAWWMDIRIDLATLKKISNYGMDRPPLSPDMELHHDLESPSSSMSALALSSVSPPPPRPVRPQSQQLESSAPTTPRASNRRIGSTRKAIRRLSRLFHRVRNQFLAHIPPWSPIAPSLHADLSPPPASAPSILNDPVDDAFDGHLSLDSVDKHNDELTHSVLEDYQPDKATHSDHISVQKNEKVELLDRFAAPDAEYVAVAVIDPDTKQPSTRRGIIPARLLSGYPTASGSAPAIANGNSVDPSSSMEGRFTFFNF
uniref:SH3 domain-containing protein n=1 Tax=Panagrellus redivivus TaxID=6233 RepID=A0A7E4VWL5_PANRE